MPQARHYENAAQRQAAYRQRQAQAHAAQLAQQALPPLPAVSTMPGQARWTALLAQAHWALAQVSQERQEYYDERSEAWQESERGEDFAQRLEAVQEVLEAMAELNAADTKNPPKPLTDHLRCLVVAQLVSLAIVWRRPRSDTFGLRLTLGALKHAHWY